MSALLIILSLSIYRQSLSQLIASVIGRQESSHGLFVPFIAAFFLWEKRSRIKNSVPECALLPGSLLIIVSAALLLAPENSFKAMLSAISFFIMMAGLTLTFFGRKIFKEVSAPLFFLMTMIPLPSPVYLYIAEWMRSINTDNAVSLTRLFGIPFERNGYYLQFPAILLHVNESCSGIRYLISYFVFGLAYAFFYKKNSASRIVVLASILPLSIFASSLRLTVIFLAVHYIGAWTTDRIPHNVLSWSVFGAVLTAALWMDWKLSSRGQRLPAQEAQR
ncbi:MAG: exosortase/archaeosortase family protein [Deltaproteobacteria bacterium]|nr:exosortase/archaeosortase family protein [Deltaproteobacteria bacterium]